MLSVGGIDVAAVEAAPELSIQEGIYPLKHTVSQGSMSNSSQADTASTADTLDCDEDEEQELDSPLASAPAPEVAAAARGPLGRKGCARRYRMVWCHERVHRQECMAQQKAIIEAARRANAGLTCIKKASKFADWLSNAKRPAHVLLTDWREVKPCLQAAAALPNARRPAFTVVVAEEERQFDRARRWISTLPPGTGPIHVCRDMSFLSTFLDRLAAASAAGGAGEFSSGGGSKQDRQGAMLALALRSVLQEVTEEDGAEARSVEVAQLRHGEERANWADLLEEELSTASTSEGHTEEALPGPAGAGLSARLQQEHPEIPMLPPKRADAILAPGRRQQEHQRVVAWRPAADAMQQEASRWQQQHSVVVDFAGPISQILSLCHPQLLEQILHEAMPDRYED